MHGKDEYMTSCGKHKMLSYSFQANIIKDDVHTIEFYFSQKMD